MDVIVRYVAAQIMQTETVKKSARKRRLTGVGKRHRGSENNTKGPDN